MPAPDTFVVPVELIKRLCTPGSLSHIIKAMVAGAELRPTGRVVIRNDRFIAEVDFVKPIHNGAQDGVLLMLDVAPERPAA